MNEEEAILVILGWECAICGLEDIGGYVSLEDAAAAGHRHYQEQHAKATP